MSWEALDSSIKNLNIDNVYVDDEGLKIPLYGRDTRTIIFKDFRVYRVSYERDLRGTIDQSVPHSLSVTDDSSFIRWFRKDAEDDIKDEEFYHTRVFDMAIIVDVISLTRPVLSEESNKRET